MARPARYFMPGYPHHLVVRGLNGMDIFHVDGDRHFFLDCLAHAGARYAMSIHAYVLMTNHVHLIASGPGADACARFFRSVGSRYALHFNRRSRRSGAVWNNRYWSNVVQTNRYLLGCMRYVEMNPVRAGMVASPEEFAWSSHRHHVDGSRNELVRPHVDYIGLADSPELRRLAYRSLFLPDGADLPPDETFRNAIRRSWAVGDDEFVRWIEGEEPGTEVPPSLLRPASVP